MATTDELPFTQKANEAIKAMLQQYGYDDVMKIHGSHPS
jgi:hypothetical protein